MSRRRAIVSGCALGVGLVLVGPRAASAGVCEDAAAGEICEAASGRCLFVTADSGSGAGTYDDPYGLADLPSADTEFCALESAAIEALNPGDILYFRAGTYELDTCSGGAVPGYLRPAQDGDADNRITFKAYPGEEVILHRASGDQTLIGGDGYRYAHFEGFVLDGVGAFSTGSYNEFAYNEFIGHTVDTTDGNYAAVYFWGDDREPGGKALGNHIHHNIMHEAVNLQGSANCRAAGLRFFDNHQAIVEHNYFHDNSCGIMDKDSGVDNAYRFNLFENNETAFLGNNQAEPDLGRYQIHDNVFDRPIDLLVLGEGHQVNDNLFFSDSMVIARTITITELEVWNNIVVSADPITAFRRSYEEELGLFDHFAYFDQNLYTAEPSYVFGTYGGPVLTMAEMGDQGWELASQQVADAAAVFEDEVSYVLLADWEMAGRYDDALGPEDVASVLDKSRYGPMGLCDEDDTGTTGGTDTGDETGTDSAGDSAGSTSGDETGASADAGSGADGGGDDGDSSGCGCRAQGSPARLLLLPLLLSLVRRRR